MTYEITFRQTLKGKSLTLEVNIPEEDMSFFENEMDYHPNVKRWRRFGGNDCCEIKTTKRKASRRRV
jgi:hypothetical protein